MPARRNRRPGARSTQTPQPGHEHGGSGPGPAERYAAARRRAADERSELTRFRTGLDFQLDTFQVEACRAVEDGRGVLVAAPTGAGKTIVGEFAVHLALHQGRKAFYTTPIKALSNQKYNDLVRRHGPERVGLLTGDTSINSHAPVVVMTTEVLRNMLYAGSTALENLGYVVMDEVHYLADRFRGPVWEEVILHLAPDVQLVSLSATVSNAEEFGAWLETVRGDMAVIVSEHRPVPLWQHVIVGKGSEPGVRSRPRLLDLYAPEAEPHASGDHPPLNPELVALLGRRGAGAPGGRRGPGARGGPRGRPGGPHEAGGRGGRGVPRFAVIDALDADGLLPAIAFVFSRAGCDDAVRQCVSAGLRLTSPAEEREIRDIVEYRCASLPAQDLEVLGYTGWVEALARGIASHHAGLLPLFKETVEELFSLGLVKVVFATETLALGINMPARSVVLEKLVKWDGTSHVDITPGEYTQLTGRAGRRGIDVEGHAVVVDHPGLDPVSLAGLASKRLYPLDSRFAPTYNMAVNLVESVGRDRARDILEMSFAQFQADRGVVGLARQAAAQSEALEGYAEAMSCDRGDFGEYMDLRRQIKEREKKLSQRQRAADRTEVAQQLEQLRRGDIVEIPSGRRAGDAVVLEVGEMTFEGPRPLVLTADRQVKRLTAADVPQGLRVRGRVRVPRGFNPRKPRERHDLAASMRAALARGTHAPEPGEGHGERVSRRSSAADDAPLLALRRRLRDHPCHACPEREDHARWAERWSRLAAENRALVRRIEGRTGTIATTFDRVCEVLLSLGYLSGRGASMAVTEDGRWLRRIYAEKDLLLAECLRRGAWDELDPAELAAAVSTVVFEAKREGSGEAHVPGGPGGRLGRALEATVRVWSELDDLEQSHHVPTVGTLETGILRPVHAWASGRSLDAVLRDSDLAAGDFVRWCKQLLDVLDQLSQVAPTVRLRETATNAMTRLRRGVVAYSSV